MPTNDTPLEREMRKAMKAIDAIAAMEDVPVLDRVKAIDRIETHAYRTVYRTARDKMRPTMQPTDDTMQQIIRMVQAGWSVEFLVPEYYQSGGIKAGKPGEPSLWIEDTNWQDDIPAAWARLVEAWKKAVGDA